MTWNITQRTRMWGSSWGRRGRVHNFVLVCWWGCTHCVSPNLIFARRWGGGGATFDTLGGGCLPLKMDCIGVKTTYGVGGGLGGVRCQKGMPNVKHRRLRVTMTGVVMIPDGGDKKGICWIWIASHWFLGNWLVEEVGWDCGFSEGCGWVMELLEETLYNS